ncbi:MAG: TIGR00341 family protein [Lachnospiraceae bacterium]|nr:TIGR00341 family protein [Lachnospiraceae bacterium]
MKMTVKEILKDAFSLESDTANYEEIRTRLVEGGQVTGTNMCVLMLAIFIASIGLNMNSTAVIIGAMLISPLMGSIQAAAYGTATADLRLFRKSVIGLMFQVMVCLITSTLYFLISPISTTTSELLARTQPTIWDVLIALFGGIAGIIGITRKEKSNVIPGVAIATALMPPLCTCGYGIATGQWRFLLGAGYLFLVNSYFIFFSSAAILLMLKVPRKKEITLEQWKRLKKVIIRNTLIMILPSIVIAYIMVQNTNADKKSLTGFEKENVSIESITKQIQILFPEVEKVEISIVEKKWEFNLTVSEELSKEKVKIMEEWIGELCSEPCEIYQKIEN